MPNETARIDAAPGAAALAPAPSLGALFFAFAWLAVSSFGGGLTGWIMHECVRKRRWRSEDEFLAGLAMAQALPGVNVVNLPIWIGYRLRGGGGAVAGVLGMVLPAMVVICLMAMMFEHLSSYAGVGLAMQGAAAAAIGLMLSMGLKAARRSIMRAAPALIMAAAFLGVGILKLSMPLVIGVLAPISVGLAWRRIRADAH